MKNFPADLCRLIAALSLLLAVLIFFELPLRALLAQAGTGNPLSGLFGPAKGFLARIDSVPSGAHIRIEGKDRGETPFLGNVSCRKGDKIHVEVSAPGYQLWQRELVCREDAQLELMARLKR